VTASETNHRGLATKMVGAIRYEGEVKRTKHKTTEDQNQNQKQEREARPQRTSKLDSGGPGRQMSVAGRKQDFQRAALTRKKVPVRKKKKTGYATRKKKWE